MPPILSFFLNTKDRTLKTIKSCTLSFYLYDDLTTRFLKDHKSMKPITARGIPINVSTQKYLNNSKNGQDSGHSSKSTQKWPERNSLDVFSFIIQICDQEKMSKDFHRDLLVKVRTKAIVLSVVIGATYRFYG